MELKKRSQDVYIGRRQEGERKPPLFVKYQFFTPGKSILHNDLDIP